MERIEEIFTDRIDDPVSAMRTEIDRNALFDLAANIKANGLINPITVRPLGDRFQVVAGHRRLSACRIAGMVKIQCVVRDLDDTRTFEIMAAENIERADVDPVDEAMFITNYIAKTNKTLNEVAISLKRSVSYVRSRLAIGQMPDYMRNYLKSGQLKLGVALILSEITDEQTRHVWTDLAVRDGANAAQAEYWLYDFKRQLLPGGTLSKEPPTGFTPEAPQVVLFECAIDGKKYDMRMMKSLMIYEGNLQYFLSFVSAFNEEPPKTELQSGGD